VVLGHFTLFKLFLPDHHITMSGISPSSDEKERRQKAGLAMSEWCVWCAPSKMLALFLRLWPADLVDIRGN